MNRVERHACFGGRQEVWKHQSTTVNCEMRFGVYLPPAAVAGERCPVLYWLAGLTCNEQNFITKAYAQELAAKLGIILVAPDTSPRGAGVPWGQKAFTAYLGADPAVWKEWDAVELIATASERLPLLVDQGDTDEFLRKQLRPELLEAACQAAGHPLTLRRHAGYDHSYYFIATFMADHLAHHAQALR